MRITRGTITFRRSTVITTLNAAAIITTTVQTGCFRRRYLVFMQDITSAAYTTLQYVITATGHILILLREDLFMYNATIRYNTAMQNTVTLSIVMITTGAIGITEGTGAEARNGTATADMGIIMITDMETTEIMAITATVITKKIKY